MKAAFTELERQKHAMVESLLQWPAEWLPRRPSAGEWSALDVLDHLQRTESGILRTVRATLVQPHAIGIRDRLGYVFLDRVFRSERRVKVPASAAAVLPGTSLQFAEILDRWRETREELDQQLGTVPSQATAGGVFRHPVSGWMTLPQVLRFFSAHIIHHAFQLERIHRSLKAAATPAES